MHEIKGPCNVSQLQKATLDYGGVWTGGLNKLPRMHAQANAVVYRDFPDLAQFLTVLDSPVVGEFRVRGEGYEALSHTKERYVAFGVPQQYSGEVRDVLPDEATHFCSIR